LGDTGKTLEVRQGGDLHAISPAIAQYGLERSPQILCPTTVRIRMRCSFRADLIDQGATFVGTAFWIRRFFTVFAIAFVIIGAAQLLKGRGAAYSLTQAALWGLASSLVFTVARYFQSRAGQQCAICKDTPEIKP
jgi:hypothetical protein